jgi:glycosyltransferase involved in cell wall biosynthesis
VSQTSLHQFLTGATSGDAITGQAFLIRDWLLDLGFKSEIYAQYVHESVAEKVKPLASYKRTRGENWAIYHHSIGSEVPEFLLQQPLTLLLIYHNITPVKYFKQADPRWANMARKGLAQLDDMRNRTGLALADSSFNELELIEKGYQNISILPITLRPEDYDEPIAASTASEIRSSTPNLLFVGRIAPNKKQADLVKLLAYVHRIYPTVRFHLIGSRWEVGYDKYIEDMAANLGLQENLVLTGKVSHQTLLTYYRSADLYVSMSEHEGFGMPLIESMYCELPVLAYGVTAVPSTMGTAGVLFTEKRYPELAELVDILLSDKPFRRRIIERQSEHVQAFLEPQTRRIFETGLRDLNLLN